MTEHEKRRLDRESLFLTADLRLNGVGGEYRVRLRNLSAGGMLAEGSVKTAPGASVEVNLPSIGWVAGSVAWVQDNRFGIALAEAIDPKRVRFPVGCSEPAPSYAEPQLSKRASSPFPRRRV